MTASASRFCRFAFSSWMIRPRTRSVHRGSGRARRCVRGRGCLRIVTARTRAVSIASPVASPPAWSTRAPGVGAFHAAGQRVAVAVEADAEAMRSRMRAGPSEQSTSTAASRHKACAGAQGVGDVLGDAVVGEHGGGDPALRVARIALGEPRLGDQRDAGGACCVRAQR